MPVGTLICTANVTVVTVDSDIRSATIHWRNRYSSYEMIVTRVINSVIMRQSYENNWTCMTCRPRPHVDSCKFEIQPVDPRIGPLRPGMRFTGDWPNSIQPYCSFMCTHLVIALTAWPGVTKSRPHDRTVGTVRSCGRSMLITTAER